ncbi:hypothetical protein BS47DRAFT_281826 [Hydnum rufescens UP504]|uniref:Uncharacterized protein n=1 Tax=Hydnum rufescens UP504 TaxID=1448309 RepID=A0A9P6AKV2_9AGAM|nr:hypothetical protein BS47DRAFT_281826 [Hydnum rufescens UP504]
MSDAPESDDDDRSSDESSRVVTPTSGLLGKDLTGGKKGKVKVSPELAETFAVNFAADEDFAFWGRDESTPEIVVKVPMIASASLPADIVTLPAPAPVLARTLVPSVDPRLGRASGSSDLVPPPAEYPTKMGGSIVPLIPATIPDVKAPTPTLVAPVTPANPRTSLRPTLSPPSFVSVPKVVQAATRTAPTIVPATNLDESFSFFNSPPTAKKPVPASSVNIVAFPTSSPSPFSMRLSLGSFSSFWSSRGAQVQPSKALPSFDKESEDKHPTKLTAPGVMSPTTTRRAQVDPDVMRERLRTRLVQEGKIPTGTVRASPASPPRRVTPKEHICVPGCKRCQGAFVEC